MMTEASAADHPLDQCREPLQAELVRNLAAEVAADFGGDLSRMRRANGYSNATWVGDGIAVRIAHTPVDMSREAALVRRLPRAVGHPEVLGDGRLRGHGWIVTAEVPGDNLQEVWSELTADKQTEAIAGLWDRARAVHQATPSLRELVPTHGGFMPASLEAAGSLARRVAWEVPLSGIEKARLRDILEEFFHASPQVPPVVNHGDLALMNALWDDGVVSLLDFEFSVLGPVEIDLSRLVYEARWSEQDGMKDSDASAAALEIALREMDPTHGRSLILGAAVLDQLRDVGIWLTRDSTDDAVEGWRPDRLLTDLLSTEGGYLSPVL
jgi:aminoglycoside phosphotransferase (APT) family kinase protein